MTVDMVALLNDADSQLLRRLVNLVLSPGVTVYEQWKMRIVSPVPKEEGNFSLDKARPLVLLDVLQKAFWARSIAIISNHIISPTFQISSRLPVHSNLSAR